MARAGVGAVVDGAVPASPAFLAHADPFLAGTVEGAPNSSRCFTTL